jgi:polyhydroxyalkanoate synthesis regulator protein
MPKLVKRYARTRLYDTEALRYVTVADLMLWVSKGIRFVVIDAETGEDITRILLCQKQTFCTAAKLALFDHLVGDGEQPRRHLDA